MTLPILPPTHHALLARFIVDRLGLQRLPTPQKLNPADLSFVFSSLVLLSKKSMDHLGSFLLFTNPLSGLCYNCIPGHYVRIRSMKTSGSRHIADDKCCFETGTRLHGAATADLHTEWKNKSRVGTTCQMSRRIELKHVGLQVSAVYNFASSTRHGHLPVGRRPFSALRERTWTRCAWRRPRIDFLWHLVSSSCSSLQLADVFVSLSQ